MGEQFYADRRRNFDFLRVVCTIAVILMRGKS